MLCRPDTRYKHGLTYMLGIRIMVPCKLSTAVTAYFSSYQLLPHDCLWSSPQSPHLSRGGGGGGEGFRIYISEDHDPISQSHNPQDITALISGKVYFKMTLTTIAPGPAGDDQR